MKNRLQNKTALFVTCCLISGFVPSGPALAEYSSDYSSASSGGFFALDAHKKCECKCSDGSGAIQNSAGESTWTFTVANKAECEVELEGEECRGERSGEPAAGTLYHCNYYTQG